MKRRRVSVSCEISPRSTDAANALPRRLKNWSSAKTAAKATRIAQPA